MPTNNLSNYLLHKELKLLHASAPNPWLQIFSCQKASSMEVCPRCAHPSSVTYDQRTVKIKDSPIRDKSVLLFVKKRRLYCKPCKKPFTEPLPGVLPRRRTTQRFRRSVLWAAETFSDLKKVRKHYRCSNDFIYSAVYEQLDLQRKMKLNYPWPEKIGLDEHAFRRSKLYGRTEFVSMIVDQSNKRLREVVLGKSSPELKHALSQIPGRENVKLATIDMCDPYKNFVHEFFPNAQCVADKFHVLRLLSPSILKKRKQITGTRADLRAKKLLLMSSYKLDFFARSTIYNYLLRHPDLHELYHWKERLHGFYRIKGFHRAQIALKHMCDDMSNSLLPEIKTLRRTLLKWKNEILNYFLYRITNARTEGFNNVAKLVKRRAYGFKNFNNYRLRLLNACC